MNQETKQRRRISEKGGGTFPGVRLLLCENPLPPLGEAIDAAREQLPLSNFYTEAYSAPLRDLLAEKLRIPVTHIHINAGSELILRQLFTLFGQQVHLVTPTYALFTEIGGNYTETVLDPDKDFRLNLADIRIPEQTTLFVLVNPNNPNGSTFDLSQIPQLLNDHPRTQFIIDEAFIGVAGQTVAHLVPRHHNLIVTRTFSKAHSLAGFRVGYAILPGAIADVMNRQNDSYPLTRTGEAAAVATLLHEDKISARVDGLRNWTAELASQMRNLGVRTFPTETYFFLADFTPLNAETLARRLSGHGFLVKPLNDSRLSHGFMRITTSTPENNHRFILALKKVLATENH